MFRSQEEGNEPVKEAGEWSVRKEGNQKNVVSWKPNEENVLRRNWFLGMCEGLNNAKVGGI